MTRTSEYQAFTSLVDRLLTVPKATIAERHAEHRKRSDANPHKRGPKPKATRPSASDHGEDAEHG
jgi:hypothetical protein